MKLILTPLCFTEGCKGSSTGSPALPTLPKAHAQLSHDSAPGTGGFRKSLGLTSSFAINPKRPGKTCNVTLALVILQKQALTRPWKDRAAPAHGTAREGAAPALAACSSSSWRSPCSCHPCHPARPGTAGTQSPRLPRELLHTWDYIPASSKADLPTHPRKSRLPDPLGSHSPNGAGRWVRAHICPGKSGQPGKGKELLPTGEEQRVSSGLVKSGCCCWRVNASDRQQAVPAKAGAPGIPHPTN